MQQPTCAEFFFIAGTPRSGSTLLVSLLSQNPLFKTGRLSGLCELMWQTKSVFDSYASQTGQPATFANETIASLPYLYHGNNGKIVFDFCRGWMNVANLDIIRKYITNQPKIICPYRNIDDVIDSYIKLFARNGRGDFCESSFYTEMLNNFHYLELALKSNDDCFLFIDYKDLVDSPLLVVKRIYSFLDIQFFEHDFMNIVCDFSDSESVHGLIGLHDVRREIGCGNTLS